VGCSITELEADVRGWINQWNKDPGRSRDVSILIGILAVLAGEAQENPASRVLQRFVRDAARYGLLAGDAGADAVLDVLSSMNHRLRIARGDYDGMP